MDSAAVVRLLCRLLERKRILGQKIDCEVAEITALNILWFSLRHSTAKHVLGFKPEIKQEK